MKSDPGGFFKMTKLRLGEDFPDHPTLPTQSISNGETLHLAGLVIETQEYGVGEASSEIIFYLRSVGALFVGDTVMDHDIPFLHGTTAPWVKQLDRLEQEYPEAQLLYPGHGDAGPPIELLSRQIDFLKTFRRVTGAHLSKGEVSLSDRARQSIIDEMIALYPDWPPGAPVPNLLRVDADALATELRPR